MIPYLLHHIPLFHNVSSAKTRRPNALTTPDVPFASNARSMNLARRRNRPLPAPSRLNPLTNCAILGTSLSFGAAPCASRWSQITYDPSLAVTRVFLSWIASRSPNLGSFHRSKRRRGGVERRQLELKGVAVCRD